MDKYTVCYEPGGEDRMDELQVCRWEAGVTPGTFIGEILWRTTNCTIGGEKQAQAIVDELYETDSLTEKQ